MLILSRHGDPFALMSPAQPSTICSRRLEHTQFVMA
jgi:hypothetical protein